MKRLLVVVVGAAVAAVSALVAKRKIRPASH
jgi:hypothetical protein